VWIVPIDVSTKKSAKLLKKSTLEVIPGAPLPGHGYCGLGRRIASPGFDPVG
jgi:hypothetical protein